MRVFLGIGLRYSFVSLLGLIHYNEETKKNFIEMKVIPKRMFEPESSKIVTRSFMVDY